MTGAQAVRNTISHTSVQPNAIQFPKFGHNGYTDIESHRDLEPESGLRTNCRYCVATVLTALTTFNTNRWRNPIDDPRLVRVSFQQSRYELQLKIDASVALQHTAERRFAALDA